MADFPWMQVAPKQRAVAHEIRRNVFARYRPLIRIGLLGPRHIFAIFVSKSAEPPDYGPESVALNECRSTPSCKYSCGGRYVDGEVGAIAPGGNVCEDNTLYFYKDIALRFPAGQQHL